MQPTYMCPFYSSQWPFYKLFRHLIAETDNLLFNFVRMLINVMLVSTTNLDLTVWRRVHHLRLIQVRGMCVSHVMRIVEVVALAMKTLLVMAPATIVRLLFTMVSRRELVSRQKLSIVVRQSQDADPDSIPDIRIPQTLEQKNMRCLLQMSCFLKFLFF